jgi:hypothetical protein
MDTLMIIVTAAGGGLLVFLFELLLKRGSIKIDNYHLKTSYHHTANFQNNITQFDLDIQFINSSGHTKIINNISATYFDGQENHHLLFEGYNVPPAGVVEQKQVKCLQFRLRPNKGIARLPIGEPHYVIVDYNIGSKSHVLRIEGNEFEALDITTPPFYMG